MNKYDILHNILDTNQAQRVKTDRKYMRIDVKTARKVLQTATNFEEAQPNGRNRFLAMSWQQIINITNKGY
jgi:hypothetical protein